MRDAKMMVCLGALAACVGAPSLSVAEDNCSGYWVQVGTTQVSLDNDPSPTLGYRDMSRRQKLHVQRQRLRQLDQPK